MTDEELLALLRDLESDGVERKSSIADRDRIREAICAFANNLPNRTVPGVVFVGVYDDGSCANLPITDELLLTLANMRSDGNILPFPMMSVEKRRLAGCEVAVIQVTFADNPPVRCHGRVWIRVGPRRAIATADEERRLIEKRRHGSLPFDQHRVLTAELADLDLELFQRTYLPSAVPPDVLSLNERTVEQQLASLHFLTKESGPNVAAILVLGKDPTALLPGAYLQFVRFDGRELTDPIRHERSIGGPLLELLRTVDDVLEANISVAIDVTSGPTELRQPDYPIVALQQLIRNAVMHRNYESSNAPVRVYWFTDRIEIHSPGGPFGQVTETNIGEPGVTDYRNPSIAEAMRALGYVQRFGLGFALARKELSTSGNPPLELACSSNAVSVTVRSRP